MIASIKKYKKQLTEAKRQLLNAQCIHKVDRGDTARFRVQAALGVVQRLDKEVGDRIAWEKWGKGPWPEDGNKV